MAKYLVVGALVSLAILGLAFAAPVEHPKDGKQEMAERFVEFLKQDQQLSGFLQKAPGVGLIRNRRATSMEDVDNVDTTTLESADAGGFFDRAAKFVMEVLQRFLKWVNTED